MEELHGAERNYSEEMKIDLERVIEMKGGDKPALKLVT